MQNHKEKKKIRIQGTQGSFNLVSSAVHGDGEKVVQENGDDSRGFGPWGKSFNLGDGQGIERDESRMKIQALQSGLSLFGQYECDFVASLNKLVGEMEELSHMAKGKPWEHDYMKFWGLGHGPVFSL